MTLNTELEPISAKEIKNTDVYLGDRKIETKDISYDPKNLDSSLENLDTSLENQEEKPRCKWCGMTFVPRRNNEKFCCDVCRHEAKKDRDRIQKRLKTSGASRGLREPLGKLGTAPQSPDKSKVGRTYEGKNCQRCGRFYIPTGPRQQFCKPDCKPLTPEQQAELDNTLKQIEINKNKAVI
jgi:ribosomal protein L37AE/L43A